MELKQIGYTSAWHEKMKAAGLDHFEAGRIAAEHRERYTVITAEGTFEGEIIGNLRYTAESRADFPAVGDWVAVSAYDDEKVLIHAVLPRTSAIERQAVGKTGEKQIIAANIDVALIIQAVNRDFSINRLERYLTICFEAQVHPILLLNKVDLIAAEQLQELVLQIEKRHPELVIITASMLDGRGLEAVVSEIRPGLTYCLLGSSGVGKSTLANRLTNTTLMTTGSISETADRGKHVTTHREMIVLPSEGILIDNPGMREIGIADASTGLETTFSELLALVEQCKYSDCTHVSESGCAIIDAVDRGEIDATTYENYLRMEREKSHYTSTVAERRKKEKQFGKMYKNVIKEKKQNKY